MAKLLDEHKCESCDDATYFVRLAQPQAVRVAPLKEGDKAYLAYADYAVIKIHNGEYGPEENRKKFSEVSVWAADESEESFPGCIYHINDRRTLDEILWILGGEFSADRTEGKLNGTA